MNPYPKNESAETKRRLQPYRQADFDIIRERLGLVIVILIILFVLAISCIT